MNSRRKSYIRCKVRETRKIQKRRAPPAHIRPAFRTRPPPKLEQVVCNAADKKRMYGERVPCDPFAHEQVVVILVITTN